MMGNSRKLMAYIARRVIGTITHVSTQDNIVALTFDDGPHPKFTPLLLEVLDRYQAHATFFMVGKAALQHRGLVKRIAQAGHAIGNHSWDHPSFPLISGKERRAQIRACERAIAPYGQRLFRPPYGHQSLASRLDVMWLGYQVITWNVFAYDHLDYSACWMAEKLTSYIKPGSLILSHDALFSFIHNRYADRKTSLKTISLLLETLQDRFCFVTVPELLKKGRPQRENWYQDASQWVNDLKMIAQ